jgi:hypothetical protein
MVVFSLQCVIVAVIIKFLFYSMEKGRPVTRPTKAARRKERKLQLERCFERLGDFLLIRLHHFHFKVVLCCESIHILILVIEGQESHIIGRNTNILSFVKLRKL